MIPMLHIYLILDVSLTRRTVEQAWGRVKCQCCFTNRRKLDKNTYFYLLLKPWTFSWQADNGWLITANTNFLSRTILYDIYRRQSDNWTNSSEYFGFLFLISSHRYSALFESYKPRGILNRVQHTSPHRTHAHTPNVMLPHHHIDFLHF
jgi:hypothetical protein